MNKKQLRTIFILLISCIFLVAGCASNSKGVSNTTKGATIGGLIGAGLGQVIGHNTKGTLIGAAIGTGIGALAGNEYDYQLEQDTVNAAVQQNREVAYRNPQTDTIVVANPGTSTYDPNTHTKCTKVHRKVIENGQVIKDRVEEECHSTKTSNTY